MSFQSHQQYHPLLTFTLFFLFDHFLFSLALYHLLLYSLFCPLVYLALLPFLTFPVSFLYLICLLHIYPTSFLCLQHILQEFHHFPFCSLVIGGVFVGCNLFKFVKYWSCKVWSCCCCRVCSSTRGTQSWDFQVDFSIRKCTPNWEGTATVLTDARVTRLEE